MIIHFKIYWWQKRLLLIRSVLRGRLHVRRKKAFGVFCIFRSSKCGFPRYNIFLTEKFLGYRLYGRVLTMKRSYGGSGIDLGPQLARRLAGARLQKCQKTGGQGGVVRASGEDKDFRSYLLLAKRAGGCCFRNF